MEQMNKKQYIDYLLNILSEAKKSGLSGEACIEKLTPKQYDFLIDCDIDLDSYLLTAEQKKAVTDIKRSSRRLSPEGYNKIYPKEKQDLFNGLVEYIQSIGGNVKLPEKVNFRDMEFILKNKKYKIVLSNPRT